MSDLKALRKELAHYMRRLYKNNLISTSGGNISLKISENEILITPSQKDKARTTAKDLIRINESGQSQNQKLKPSLEWGFHWEAYHKRPDIQAVVHAHPLAATSLIVTHQAIRTDLTGEARAILGLISEARYALMGSEELAQEIGIALKNSNVVLMENHGVLTVGKSLTEAYDRMEILENCARLTLLSRMLGGGEALSAAKLQAIDQLISGK